MTTGDGEEDRVNVVEFTIELARTGSSIYIQELVCNTYPRSDLQNCGKFPSILHLETTLHIRPFFLALF